MYTNSNDLLDLVLQRQREFLFEVEKDHLLREAMKQKKRDATHTIWILARFGHQLAQLGRYLEWRYGVVPSSYAGIQQGNCKESELEA